MKLSEIRKAAARLKENYRGWWEFVFYDWDKFRHSTQREYDEFRKGGLMKFAAAIREELSTINDWVTNLDGEKPKPMTRVLLNEVVESIKEVKQIDGHPFTVGCVREVVDWSGIVTLSQQITMTLNLYEYRAFADTLPPATEEATEQTTGTPHPTKAPQQITDEAKETVKPYFTAAFKGIGKENDTNYFEILIADLIRRKTAKEKATILLLAFESKEVNTKRPKSFAEWLRIWGNVLGCKLDYKQNKLDISTVVGQCYYLHLKGGQAPK